MKPLSEVALGLLVIQIPIQGLCGAPSATALFSISRWVSLTPSPRVPAAAAARELAPPSASGVPIVSSWERSEGSSAIVTPGRHLRVEGRLKHIVVSQEIVDLLRYVQALVVQPRPQGHNV